ncbi:PREDICTED: transcription factor GTE10-like isoform X2 [Camelina sativa]|uniref:Transcription factor GTE10-like isoform X2 n=1 Tax=Camelina sativa TaxID=90675 RepID=A0ABM0XCX2_CAMSA|nr:PREDICTED: transcription factor GTE10-like isoform X2 [Camelina sativa]
MMGKARKHPRVKSSGFVPDYLQTAVEPDDFAYSGRIDSQMKHLEETPPLKRRRFGLNGDSYGVPKEVFSLANLSRSERKNLVHKLKMELQQVRDLSKKIACFSSDTVLLSPYNDIQSCSDGPRRMPPENFATFPGSQGKKRPAVRIDKQRTKKGPSRLDVPTNSTLASVMKECETLLNRLWSHKLGWAFRTPVDPVMLNIPDYFTVIKHPMDLGTIRSRLRKGEYSSPLDFAADVRLTFSNSIAYNPPGNQYHAMAQGISKYFESGWKSIEKKIPVTKPPVVPVTSSASLDSEIPFEVVPLRKKAATMNENKQRVAPAKLVMTDDEKKKISQDLVALEEDFPQNIVDLLREQSGNDGQSGEVEIEIDIESLSDETLFKVRKLLDDYLSEKKKSLEKSEPCEIEIVHDSGFSNSPLQPSKGDLQIDEDVDIVGGNDPSVSSHPPPKIEKDAACRNNESSSSSSSSSESGSSSSDSGSSSSSGSETDSNKASKPTSREDKKEPGVGINRKEDNCNSEKIVVNEETAPPERQISPDKRYRQALLKNRFADTIMKAREKALTKGEKGDPEKLRIEREKFEKRLREEKVRLQAEAKAAEEVRRKAKAEAAEKVRREREQEREAARQALQKMEKTVEINEGIRFMEDLQMFRATGSEGDQLPTSMDEMSPKCSEDMLGSFKIEGSNPLAHLGLYMKMDEDEDEEEDPPHFSQREVEDHLTDRSEKQELSPHRVEREDQLVSGNEEPVSEKVHDNKGQEDEKPINPNEREDQVGNVPEQESRVVDKEEQETDDVDMREQKNEVVDMGVEEEHSFERSQGRTLSPDRKEGVDQLVSGNEESVSEKVQDYGNQKEEKFINHSEKEELVENVLEQESRVDDKGDRETKVVEMGEQENEVVDKGVEKELRLDRKEGQILSSHRGEVEDQLVSGNEELGSQKTDNENEEYENPINQNEREQVANAPEQESRVTGKEDQETEVVDMGEQKSEVIEKGIEENEDVDTGVQGNEVVEKGRKETEVVDNGEDDETDLVGEQETDVVDKAAEKETDLVDKEEEETEDVDVEID